MTNMRYASMWHSGDPLPQLWQHFCLFWILVLVHIWIIMMMSVMTMLPIMAIFSTCFRSTGEDDLDLSCKNGFEDEGGEDLEEVDNKEVAEEEKKREGGEHEEEEKKEEEEDLEYLRLNCTRMSTRRATNFSQVCRRCCCRTCSLLCKHSVTLSPSL